MKSAYKIPVLIFFFLCFSFLSFAEEKIYTNEDLKQAPSLDRDSRIDPATGKVINNEREASVITSYSIHYTKLYDRP